MCNRQILGRLANLWVFITHKKKKPKNSQDLSITNLFIEHLIYWFYWLKLKENGAERDEEQLNKKLAIWQSVV